MLLVYVTVRLATDFNHFVGDGWRRLVLPMWLTAGTLVGLVPVLGLWSCYSSLFKHLNWAIEDRRTRRIARLTLVLGLHVRARLVGAFNGMWCKEFRGLTSLREARAIVKRFREQRAAEPSDRPSIPASRVSTAAS